MTFRHELHSHSHPYFFRFNLTINFYHFSWLTIIDAAIPSLQNCKYERHAKKELMQGNREASSKVIALANQETLPK